LSGEEGQALEFLSHNNGVDFLAIVSPYFSETLAEKGDVMIPIPFWMEEDGTYTSLDGLKIAYKKKVVNSPKDMQETWQTLMSLSDRAGFDPKLKTWNDLRKKTEESIKRDDRASKK
jgi:NADH dehydrogenase/NADH:ubiquinone oxidoreductase subunit G